MGDVIFCKTRYQDIGYASYNDLWRLVELAEYPIIYVDELDPQSDNTYIVTPLNDEWLAGWNPKTLKARIIHWEFEWRTDWRATVDEPPGVAEVWAMDKAYAAKIGARYVPVGSDERLNVVYASEVEHKKYDVSLLSYQTPRRQVITQQLRDERIILAPIDGLIGMERSAALCHSRVMVHCHQLDNMAGIASLRWCLAAAHHLPIISETVPDRGIFGYTHMMQADYSFLASFTAAALRDRRMLADYSEALHGLLCEDYTFAKGINSHV